MNRIPRVVPPQPDELLYSWQERLSVLNGFDHLYEFARAYIYPNCRSQQDYHDRKVSIDGREDFILFAKALGLDNYIDIVDLYLKTTVFPALIPIYTEVQQQDYLLTAVEDGGHSGHKRKLKSAFTTLSYCPICRQKDYAALGFTYIRRSHQLPGVSVCHEHLIKLLPLSSGASEDTVIQGAADEVHYAKFLSDLLDTRMNASWTSISEDIASRSIDFRNLNSRVAPVSGYRIMLQTYRDVTGVTSIFPDAYSDLYGRIEAIWSEYAPSISQPVKGIRTQHSFENEVRDLCGNEYTVISFVSGRTGSHATAKIRHEKCGNIQAYDVSDFLVGQRCRYCTHMVSMNAFQAFVAQQSCGRYKVLGQEGSNLILLRDTQQDKTIALSKSQILQELRRPTPSPILPCLRPSTESALLGSLKDEFSDYLHNNYPDDAEIHLCQLSYKDLSYAKIKSLIHSLIERRELVRIGKGCYRFTNSSESFPAPLTKLERVWGWIQENCEPGQIMALQDLREVFQNEISYEELKQLTIIMRERKLIQHVARGKYIRNDIPQEFDKQLVKNRMEIIYEWITHTFRSDEIITLSAVRSEFSNRFTYDSLRRSVQGLCEKGLLIRVAPGQFCLNAGDVQPNPTKAARLLNWLRANHSDGSIFTRQELITHFSPNYSSNSIASFLCKCNRQGYIKNIGRGQYILGGVDNEKDIRKRKTA